MYCTKGGGERNFNPTEQQYFPLLYSFYMAQHPFCTWKSSTLHLLRRMSYEVRVSVRLQKREGSNESLSVLSKLDFRILPCIKGDIKSFWLPIFSLSSIHYGSPICKLLIEPDGKSGVWISNILLVHKVERRRKSTLTCQIWKSNPMKPYEIFLFLFFPAREFLRVFFPPRIATSLLKIP